MSRLYPRTKPRDETVWNCPVAFRDVDYLDIVGIDLKAQTQLGQDILIGSLTFHAHEVRIRLDSQRAPVGANIVYVRDFLFVMCVAVVHVWRPAWWWCLGAKV